MKHLKKFNESENLYKKYDFRDQPDWELYPLDLEIIDFDERTLNRLFGLSDRLTPNWKILSGRHGGLPSGGSMTDIPTKDGKTSYPFVIEHEFEGVDKMVYLHRYEIFQGEDYYFYVCFQEWRIGIDDSPEECMDIIWWKADDFEGLEQLLKKQKVI